MRNLVVGFLVGIATSIGVFWCNTACRAQPTPRGRFAEAHAAKARHAVERLKRRLACPDSLEVVGTSILPVLPDPDGADRLVSVEVRFTAAAPDGTRHAALFVVRWHDGTPHDILPDDDTLGLFTPP